jgi:hypothetical protein
MYVGIASFNLYSLKAVMKARQMFAFPPVTSTEQCEQSTGINIVMIYAFPPNNYGIAFSEPMSMQTEKRCGESPFWCSQALVFRDEYHPAFNPETNATGRVYV